jgi:hypothetical protein
MSPDEKEDKEEKKEEKEDKEEEKKDEKEEKKEEKKDEKEEKESEEYVDPSIAKMKDLQKLVTNPPKIPGLEVLEVEPKATIAVSNILDTILNSLMDPTLTQSIIDNIKKSLELKLENNINKIEYLKKDTKKINEHEDISNIINDIHNESYNNKVSLVKGGKPSFFNEEECSFF